MSAVHTIKKQRTFLRRIYLWITLAMLLPLTSFAVVAYISSGKTILDNEYQSNKKILSQMEFNIDYMNDMILNSVYSLYQDPDVRAIMYNNNPDFGDLIREINTLKSSIVNANPFIHSIYLYNNHTHMYYTTLDELNFQDTGLETMLQSGKPLPILKPVPRQITFPIGGDKSRGENVVSYFMYDYKDKNNVPDGALIVNSSTEWILHNIENINLMDEQQKGRILILDGNGQEVGTANPEDLPFVSSLKVIFQGHQHIQSQASADPIGYFTSDIGGQKYLITYTYSEKMNWTIIKAQLYDEVLQGTNTLKLTFFLMTAGFLLIGFLISVLLSRRIYKPIGQLVTRILSTDEERGLRKSNDEFSYLNEAFQHSIEQLALYKERRSSEKEVMKSYFLRKLLVDSESVSAQEFAQACNDLRVRLNESAPLQICIVKIDDFRMFKEKYSPLDRALYTFGMMNISSELLSKEFTCEAVEMKDDYIAFILSGEITPQSLPSLLELWKQAQHFIMKYYRISFSVFIGESAGGFKRLSERHFVALENSSYRFIFGKACILTEETICSHAHNPQLGYSRTIEKKLVDAMKSGNLPMAEESLGKIFKEVSLLSYNNALLSVMNLMNTLKTTVDEISRAKVEPVRVNFNQLTQRLFVLETLEELHGSIAPLLTELISKTESIENEKQAIVVDTIKELIEADYANPQMCMQYVTDKLNLSPKSLSKIFSARMSMSVADYINEVRLGKAVDWLENTSLSIKEILVKIGMENESYFYKLFKKKYGTTPKEYMLNRSLRQIQSKE